MKIKSLILVIIQVAAIVILCVTDRAFCLEIPLFSVQVASIILLIWTWIHLHPGKFHILPDVMKDAKLITTGPFRFIRHPMYLGLFLYLLPLVIEYFSYLRLAVLIIFVINMIIKMYYEEKLMLLKFPQYAEYMKHSKRIVPYIY